MPDQTGMTMIPPGVDPGEWYQTQRKMALAQALQQMSLSPAQGDVQQPAGGGKFYQAARVRPITALSKLAEAMLANRGFKQTFPAMAQQYNRAAGAFAPGGQTTSGTPLEAAPPAANPNEQSVQPALQRLPGASFQQTIQASQPQTSPVNPLNPNGLPPSLAFRMYMSDPAKYAELLAGTPEWRTALSAAGGDPNRAMQMLQAEAAKKGAIDVRSGGMTMIPDGRGGYVRMRAPNLPPGYEPEFDAQGNLTGTHPAAGLIPGEAATAAATTAAKEANTPRMIPQGGGVEALGYPPTPPALRSPAAPSGQYFKQPAPSAQMPSAPPSARAQAPWLQSAPKLQIPNTPGQTTDAYHQRILDKAADKHIELADKYGSEADLADARIAFNNEAISLLKNGNPEMGPLSDKLTKLRARALEMGVPASWIPGADKVKDTQEIKKYFLRNPLLNLKPTFGGRPAAAEFQVLRTEASPSEEMLSQAAQKLLEIDNTQAGYVKQRAQDYGLYHQASGDPLRFESYYANTHPFAKALNPSPTGPKSIASDAEYEALKSGEEFIDPQGKHRRKP